MFSDAANRRYTLWTAACWALFLGLTATASNLGPANFGSVPGSVLALAIAVPVGVHVVATLKLINSGDEFARAITSKRFIVAWGISTAAFCMWGFLEQYAATPPAPAWAIYPLFWLAFAFVSMFVHSSR